MSDCHYLTFINPSVLLYPISEEANISDLPPNA